MRRWASLGLLLLMGVLPSAAPLFALAFTGASVPACCRAAGAHRCLIAAHARAEALGADAPAVFSRCPMRRQTAAVVPTQAAIAGGTLAGARIESLFLVFPPQSEACVSGAVLSARPRAPPVAA